jgi:ferritin-like metal-binding protein YciE
MAAKQKNMQDLLVEEMRDTYNAEQQLVRALPRLAKATTSPELRQAFEMHLEQTRGQVERLQQAFQAMDVNARGKTCHAMEGLVEEARELIDGGLAPEVLDAALISAAQKVEHYEIASYGTLVAYAEACGFPDVVELLRQTLEEEKATDAKLNDLALQGINAKAVEASRAA